MLIIPVSRVAKKSPRPATQTHGSSTIVDRIKARSSMRLIVVGSYWSNILSAVEMKIKSQEACCR